MVASEAEGTIPPQVVRNEANPGRWVGGAVGVLVCLGLVVVGEVFWPGGTTVGSGFLTFSLGTQGFQGLGVAGIPIALLGGRALLPDARSGGWKVALGFGVLFGLLVPPLGAIEIIAGSTLSGSGSLYYLYFLPVALFYSYLVVVVTIPCGLVWALMVRAIPETALRGLEAPRPLARLGARHAVVVAVVAWIAAMLRLYVV